MTIAYLKECIVIIRSIVAAAIAMGSEVYRVRVVAESWTSLVNGDPVNLAIDIDGCDSRPARIGRIAFPAFVTTAWSLVPGIWNAMVVRLSSPSEWYIAPFTWPGLRIRFPSGQAPHSYEQM